MRHRRHEEVAFLDLLCFGTIWECRSNELFCVRLSVVCIIYTFGTHVLQSKHYVGCQTARHAQRILYCNTRNHGLVCRYEKRNEDEAYDGLLCHPT